MVISLTPFRDPKELIENISDIRQHVFKSFLGKTLKDHSFNENYEEELKLTDNFDESVFDKIANMYSLKKSSFKVSPSQLNEEQYQIYKDLIYSKGRFHIISGSPGTGKSFLLRSIKDGCMSLNTQCTITASTGCAVFLVGGTTIHSKLQLRYYEHISEWQTLLFSSQKWQELEKTSVLILDEISMIGNDLFNKIMNILSDSRLSHIKFIMFGDPFQLDPVGDISFFRSPYFQHFEKHKLKINQRTKDEILSNLISNFYNIDIKSEDRLLQTLNFINSRLTDFNMHDDSAYVYAFNSECRNHNRAVLRSLNRKIHHIKLDNSSDSNSFYNLPQNSSIKKKFRFYDVLDICIDARVMLLINKDIDNGLVNGSIGVVRHIEYGNKNLNEIHIEVEFISKDKTFSIRLTPHKEMHEDVVLWQFPIAPAYATSVHKIQGMTLSKIVVGNLSNFWSTQQLYVALSRVKNAGSIQFLRPSNKEQLYTSLDFKQSRYNGGSLFDHIFLNGIDF